MHALEIGLPFRHPCYSSFIGFTGSKEGFQYQCEVLPPFLLNKKLSETNFIKIETVTLIASHSSDKVRGWVFEVTGVLFVA